MNFSEQFHFECFFFRVINVINAAEKWQGRGKSCLLHLGSFSSGDPSCLLFLSGKAMCLQSFSDRRIRKWQKTTAVRKHGCQTSERALRRASKEADFIQERSPSLQRTWKVMEGVNNNNNNPEASEEWGVGERKPQNCLLGLLFKLAGRNRAGRDSDGTWGGVTSWLHSLHHPCHHSVPFCHTPSTQNRSIWEGTRCRWPSANSAPGKPHGSPPEPQMLCLRLERRQGGKCEWIIFCVEQKEDVY